MNSNKREFKIYSNWKLVAILISASMNYHNKQIRKETRRSNKDRPFESLKKGLGVSKSITNPVFIHGITDKR